MKPLQIKEIALSRLKPYENNAKIHTPQQIKKIMRSIEELGFNDPIGIDNKGVIIEGHGRYEACRRLGMETVPCIILSHMTETQKKAYIIAHNKLTMETGFDFKKLQEEFEDLRDNDFDMDLTGFEEIEIKPYIDNDNEKEFLNSIKSSVCNDNEKQEEFKVIVKFDEKKVRDAFFKKLLLKQYNCEKM